MSLSYYEELGLEPGASPEEIRLAHKRLARLFHPDRVGDDPELRRLAEAQMKRLNRICEALLAEASASGRSPRAVGAGPQAPAWFRRARQWFPMGPRLARWGWAWVASGVGILALALLALWDHQPSYSPQGAVVLESRGSPEPAHRSVAARSSLAEPSLPRAAREQLQQLQGENRRLLAELNRLQAQLQEAQAERSAAVARLAALRAELGSEPRPSPRAPEPPQPPASLPPVEAPLENPGPPAEGLSGLWVFAPEHGPDPPAHTEGLYSPEFIELLVREEAGNLAGSYRARYRVPDRALSPVVTFEFSGPSHPGDRFLWRGPGGAAGEVRLHLVGPNRLLVEWQAHRISSQLSLVSGAALLIRARP